LGCTTGSVAMHQQCLTLVQAGRGSYWAPLLPSQLVSPAPLPHSPPPAPILLCPEQETEKSTSMCVHKHIQAIQLEHHKMGQLEVSSGNPSYACMYICMCVCQPGCTGQRQEVLQIQELHVLTDGWQRMCFNPLAQEFEILARPSRIVCCC